MKTRIKKIYKHKVIHNSMDNKGRLSDLSSFLKLLKENLNFDFNIRSLDDRIKLQKYVFISKSFGLDLGYNYSLYIHGPYSPDLAKDYYNLNLKDYNTTHLERRFNWRNFKLAVQGKSVKWLEISVTALSVKETNPDLSRDELLDILIKIKGEAYDKKDIKEIFNEAINYGFPL